MPAVTKKHCPQELWKPLQPIILQDPVLCRLAKGHLLLLSAVTSLLIDCVHGVYRPHLFGYPKRLKPSKIDGEVLIDTARDFRSFRDRRWELYEQICQLGIFIEVSSLEYDIYEVYDEAYNRDDVSDWFAFSNGHAIPIFYSVRVIIQALQNVQPRIRLLAAAALGYLVRHRGHGCYSKSENSSLDTAYRVLEEVSIRLNDKELIEVYLDSLKRRSI